MSIEIISFAILSLVMNVMDSVTTRIGFNQYPEKELKGEMNPIMRHVMLKNRILADIIKQCLGLALIWWLLYLRDIASIRMIFLFLLGVVLSNSSIIISRAIAKKKVRSHLRIVQDYLHIPNWFMYPLALIEVVIFTSLVYWLVWR